MQTRVSKWGNSLALRIPKPLAAQIGLNQNSTVELSLIEGKLVVTPTIPDSPNLDVLLAQITQQNLHQEVDTGPALGNEIW